MKKLNTLLVNTLIIWCMPVLLFAQNQDTTDYYMNQIGFQLENLINASPMRGATATVYYGNDYYSISKGVKSNGIPIDSDDWYLFRSLTKTMVSTVILQLQEEGRLNIDDALSDHIGPVQNVDMTITLRELLSMRANVCEFLSNTYPIISQDPAAVLDVKEVLDETIPSGFCNSSNAYSYNDTNFQLLGLVIEAVTGNNGEDEIKSRLFDPLISNTASIAPLNQPAETYNGLWSSPRGPGTPVSDVGAVSKNSLLTAHKFNAGSVGSTRDMLQFVIALINGTFLSELSMEAMMTFGAENYGMGLMRRDFGDGYVMYGHGGSGLHASRTFYDPDRKLGVSVAGNFNDRDNMEVMLNNIYTLLNECVEAGGCNFLNGTIVEKTFSHEGQERNYSVYVPETYDPEMTWPLVVNFHGYTGDIQDQINRTKMNELADEYGFLIAYPLGLEVTRAAGFLPPFVPMSGKGWSVPGFSDQRDELSFMNALLDELESGYSVNKNRVHTTGLSLGGYMALYVATQIPDRILSFASVAGHMTDEVNSMLNANTQISAMLVHGTEDIIADYGGREGFYPSVPEVARIFAAQNECSTDPLESQLSDLDTSDNSTVTLLEYGGCDTASSKPLLVKLYRVNNGGHRWPGSGITDPAGLGNNSRDLNTSKAILDFFSETSTIIDSNEEQPDIADAIELSQNYPNPFNPTTNIFFSLPQAAEVSLKVYNVLGQEVASVLQERLNAGSHTAVFDASDLPSGIYIYRLVAGTYSATKKMMLIK